MIKLNKTSITIALYLPLFLGFSCAVAPKKPATVTDSNPRTYETSSTRFRTKGKKELESLNGFNGRSMALSYLKLGSLPEALEAYKKVRGYAVPEESELDLYQIQCEYAYALALTGSFEASLAVLDTARILRPSAKLAYQVAGWVFLFSGFGDVTKDLWKLGEFETELDKSIGALSLTPVDEEFENELGVKSGAVVLTVFPGRQSELQSGDVILSINSIPVRSLQTLNQTLSSQAVGTKLALKIWRDRREKTIYSLVSSIKARLKTHLPKSAKVPAKPTPALLREVDNADLLLAENNVFLAAYSYRRLIQRFPGWALPLFNYSHALEEFGSYPASIDAMSRASRLSKDPLVKNIVDERLSDLTKKGRINGASWRGDQPEGPPVYEQLVRPSGVYVGFAGGQYSFGDGKTPLLNISGRLGSLFAWGTDVSLGVGYNATSKVTYDTVVFQRFTAAEGAEDTTINLGGRGTIRTVGDPSYGPLFGISTFYGKRKQKSFDFFIDWTISKTQSLGITFGWTTFLVADQ
jgi:tetratricopeptide (TPR) repeat protein